MKHASVRFWCCVLLVSFLSGCFLAPAIDSFKKAGLTSSDRQRLLGQRMKEFHEALYWGDVDMALGYVDSEKQPEIRPILEGVSSSEKLVETKVMSTNFSESSFDAHVRMKVKSYRVPFYVVNERIDEQDWKFDLSTGWLLTAFKKGA